MILDRFRLQDKVAIVTGAGRGIGEAIALAFAEAGAHVVCAARSQDQIEQTAEAIEAMGQRALAVVCDVNERADLENLVDQTLQTFGRIDILVNNAGGSPYAPALRTGEAMFEQALKFNATTAFVLTKLVVPHMLESEGGSVLNITSTLGHSCERGFVAYGTAKAAMTHMTRLLGYEFAPKVRVNGIGVGATLTSALAPFVADPAMEQGMLAKTPMRRLGQPEDIACAAVYLSSPAASYVTGKILEVDGGLLGSNFPIELPDL